MIFQINFSNTMFCVCVCVVKSLGVGSGHLQAGAVRARSVSVRFGVHTGGRGRGALLLCLSAVETSHQRPALPQDHRIHLDIGRRLHLALDDRLPAAHHPPADRRESFNDILSIRFESRHFDLIYEEFLLIFYRN